MVVVFLQYTLTTGNAYLHCVYHFGLAKSIRDAESANASAVTLQYTHGLYLPSKRDGACDLFYDKQYPLVRYKTTVHKMALPAQPEDYEIKDGVRSVDGAHKAQGNFGLVGDRVQYVGLRGGTSGCRTLGVTLRNYQICFMALYSFHGEYFHSEPIAKIWVKIWCGVFALLMLPTK